MTPEDWFARAQGTLDGIVQVCAMLLATHPNREEVRKLTLALMQHAAPRPEDSGQQTHYRAGMMNVASAMSSAASVAEFAAQARAAKSSGDVH